MQRSEKLHSLQNFSSFLSGINPALIFSTSLQILITSRRSELRTPTRLRRPKLTYSTKAKGTSFPFSASRSRTRAAACIRSEAHTPCSGQLPGFKIDGTCTPSKQTSLEGTPLRLSLSEERNGSVLTGVSAASMGSFPYSSSAPRRLAAISGILALARCFSFLKNLSLNICKFSWKQERQVCTRLCQGNFKLFIQVIGV